MRRSHRLKKIVIYGEKASAKVLNNVGVLTIVNSGILEIN